MPNDREKLLRIMDSLEHDYSAGKISPEKYSYFRSKYEDKLNSIDALEATRRIRSMQGKPTSNTKNKRSTRPVANNAEKQEDLVQKYIINPKKDDTKYNKKEKKSMSSGTFKLVLLLVLVIGFTVGVGYGVFNLDFDNISDTNPVGIVEDTAFPDFTEDIVQNTTYNSSSYVNSNNSIKTTQDTSGSDISDDSSSGGDSSGGGSSGGGGSSSGGGSSGGSDSGGDDGE